MKKYIVSVLVLGFIFIGGNLYAEGPSTSNKSAVPALLGNQGQGITQQNKETNEEMRKEMQEKREGILENLKQKSEEFKDELQKKRTEMKKVMATHRETLQNKLKNIKNERKQNSVLKISDNFEKINEKATERLNNLVDQIEKVLEKIINRVDKAEDEGRDVSEARLAVKKAQEAISSARSAIITQTAQIYTIEVVDEETLKEVTKTVRDEFYSNIKAVQDKIKTAHEAIRKTAKTLGSLQGLLEDNEEEGDEE